MNTIKATVRNRRIDLPAPEDLLDGTEVLVDVTPLSVGQIGIRESDWRNDLAALADWDAWLKTLEPLELTPEEEAAHARYEEAFRRFNLEAVRQQMAAGGGE